MIKKLFALISTLALAFPASADTLAPLPRETLPPLVIDHNPGGYINVFLDNIQKWGDREIRIRGNCWSACTLYLSAKNVCAYPSASFHFHAPYYEESSVYLGSWIYWSYAETARLEAVYPESVRKWIEYRGGLGRDWLHMYGRTIFDHVKRCDSADIDKVQSKRTGYLGV